MVKKAKGLRPNVRLRTLIAASPTLTAGRPSWVALRLRDAVSEVALDRNAALLRIERTHLTEEMERQRETMSTLEQGQVAVTSLKALREHMCDRLDSATPEDRRTVLEILETRVTVGVGGILEVSIGIPQQVADCVQRTQGPLDTIGLPV